MNLIKVLMAVYLFTLLSACGPGAVYVTQGPKGEKGDQGEVGNQGAPGQNGVDGVNGNNGLNGFNSLIALVNSASSCSTGGITVLSGLDTNQNNTLDTAEVQSSSEVCNGAVGPSPTAFTHAINPCGDNPSLIDEVIISDGQGNIFGSFSDNASGHNTRFALIPPGNYITTDGDLCRFTINADGSISNENKHF